MGKGVSISSNIIGFCLNNKIAIDFFGPKGEHVGTILSERFMENTLWRKQAELGDEVRVRLATDFIRAKLKNQLYLVKYFHKYHKTLHPTLQEKYMDLEMFVDTFKEFERHANYASSDYFTQLVAKEAQGAVKYWAYIRELLDDDDVGFERREHHGATDLVNSMLNYGYAILYARTWQALLAAKLNPFESVVHVRQPGKPTFVYDVVEMFRSQVVDRIVVSLIQKGIELSVDSKGMLVDATKKLLAKSILERLHRYEAYRGESITMTQIMQRQAREIAAHIDTGEKYKPYIAKW